MDKEELIKTLTDLKAGYISSLNSLDVMMNWGKTQLEALYSTKIGRLKIELLQLQIEVKALKKKIQLCHQAINRDEAPDFDEIETTVKLLTGKAYEEVMEEKEKLAFATAVLSNLASPEDSMELRKIFRTVAKNLHPDVNPNLTGEQIEIWHLFYAAYKSGDLDKMKALEIVYKDDLQHADQQTKELTETDYLLQIDMLKEGIKELERKIKEVEAEFPFSIAELIRDDEWVAEQQDIIKKETAELKDAVAELKHNYQIIKECYE